MLRRHPKEFDEITQLAAYKKRIYLLDWDTHDEFLMLEGSFENN